MSSLDKLLDTQPTDKQIDPIAAIRTLAVNKDIRTFLTSLCKYSKADWSAFLRTCRVIYGVMQSSLLIKQDSKFMDEIVKVPHIAVFFRRLTEEDV